MDMNNDKVNEFQATRSFKLGRGAGKNLILKHIGELLLSTTIT